MSCEEFVSCYLSLGKDRSIMNDELHAMGMLCLIGSSIRDAKLNIRGSPIDLRIHPLIIQRSGSGKDAVFNLASEIAEKAGINFVSQTSITSAAFIGSAGKSREPVPGVASTSDILAFKEISSLFSASKSEHSSDIINLLNQAMDYGGWIKKDLGGMSGSISYKTRVSLFGTTYPPRTRISYIEAGFLPRTLFGYKEIGKDFYLKVVDWMFENVGELESSSDSDKIKYLSDELRKLKILTYNRRFSFPEKSAFSRIKDTFVDALEKYPIRVQQSVEPYITRTAVNAIKVSCCFASLDNTMTVRKKHIDLAGDIMKYSIDGLLRFHSKYDTLVSSTTNIVRNILYRIKEDTNTTTVRDIVRMSGGLSLRDVMNALDTLKAAGEIEISVDFSKPTPEKTVVIL